MADPDELDISKATTRRPRYRQPVGMPMRDEGRRAGAVVSVVVHALIILLLIIPFFMPHSVIRRMQQGAGGAGPAGGGGGGTEGTGGETVEHLQFVKVLPNPVPTPSTLPPITPPPKPVPKPVPEPEPPKTPPVTAAPVPQPQSVVPAAPVTVAAVPGTGGGSGTDGSVGAGPGTGGGVGSGVGTGRGSATGAGTGGGTQANYPPVPIEFFLPPLPAPSSVRGLHFIAEFDVDSTGRVLAFDFTRTRDGDYNKRLADVLRAMRFRPGTRPDGSPLRMKAQVGYEF
jgi:periplasmic protein TonB